MIKQLMSGGLCILASMATYAEDAVSFEVTLTKGGHVISNPRMVGHFDKTMSVEVSRTMKFEALAKSPDSAGVSYTKAKISLFDGQTVSASHEFTIAADLAKGTSVEYELPGTDARVRVVQRRVSL
jgi:hypothetical protein